MAITRIPNTRSATVSRKARRLAVKGRRLAAKRAKASAVVVESASFKMRLLRGAGGLAFAVAAAPFRLLNTRVAEPTNKEAKHRRDIARLERHHAFLDMVRTEHAYNMARIELDRMDANLEQLTAPPSLWSQVSTAAMYVGIGAVVASNPGATYAVANAAVTVANAAVIAGQYAGRYALAMAF
jgi:hypothetical protein